MKNIIFFIFALIISGCSTTAIKEKEEVKLVHVQGKIDFDGSAKIPKTSIVSIGLEEIESKKIVSEYNKPITENGIYFQITVNEKDIDKSKKYAMKCAVRYKDYILYYNKQPKEVINNGLFNPLIILNKNKNTKYNEQEEELKRIAEEAEEKLSIFEI